MKIRTFQLYSMIGFLMICMLSPSAHSAETRDNKISFSQLNLEIKEFIQDQMEGKFQGRIDVRLSGFDQRYGIKSCDVPLHYELPRYSKISGRTSINVSCQGKKQWRMLLPVQLSVFKPIVAATRNLSRNEPITAEALTMVDANILTLTQGYFDNKEALQGLVIDRQVRAGDYFTPANVTLPVLVHRGDLIRLSAKGKGIAVQTTALSMENGKMGDSIQVKNSRSQKVVQAIVTGAQTVEVF